MSRSHPAPSRLAALALAVTVLSGGCAGLAPADPTAHVYTGRFAVSASAGEHQHALSGRFTLTTSPARTTLDLASALGTTLARLHSEAGRATLTAPRADGTMATWEGDDPEMLVESALGFGLPVSGLADWLAGRPAAGRPARIEPQTGPTRRIEQDGWRIDIERIEDTSPPYRLTLDRSPDAPGAAAIRLRLVVDAPQAPAAARDPLFQ